MINSEQKIFLRSASHHKSIVVWIGQKGLTKNVAKEIEMALDYHELVKVRIRLDDREVRDKLIKKICKEHEAHLVQKIGSVILLFRQSTENPQIILPH